jgi:hypothetical protein
VLSGSAGIVRNALPTFVNCFMLLEIASHLALPSKTDIRTNAGRSIGNTRIE